MKRYFYDQIIKTPSDLDKPEFAGFKFMAIEGYSESHMGADYGPPDPPPSSETHHYTRCIVLKDEEEVGEWVQQQEAGNSWSKPKYKIVRIEPVKISTTVKVSVE